MDIKGLHNQMIESYRPRTERTEDAADKAARAKDTRPGGEGDTLRLSHEAMLRATARSTAMQADDIRQERVDSLRAQIANGTYRIDNEKIATKLVQEETELVSPA
ncbi:MAG: flagellar biosynthesis anti-sigma factor FlgM [Deltaproteobacteria bacterium]|jgi:negative regulator of flagellin synthesis FlgM|nr:flagellar biosynthesis anti-sigma factor FlgM [Deltaproteobacteria bacterium]